MIQKDADQEQSTPLIEDSKQFRIALFVYVVIEFFAIVILIYKKMR